MKHDFLKELAAALAFIVLSIALVNPFGVWMPDSAHMLVLALVVVAFGAFAVFVLHESPADEREETHRQEAGHIAYLVGAGLLLCGIVVETLAHMLDPWLVYALVGMILAKAAMHTYDTLYR
jgi:hypothetical protein